MTRGELVVQEAREWVGTPFVWQAAQKGRGCDCKGLVCGIARELKFPEANTFHAAISDYPADKPVPSDLLKEGMAAIFDRVEEMRPGDILLCKHGGSPSHLAIYTGNQRAIHTQISSKAWTKDTALRALLFKYPLDSIWRWRD